MYFPTFEICWPTKAPFCYNKKSMNGQNVRTLITVSILLILSLSISLFVHAESDQIEMLIQNLNSEYRDLRLSAVWTLGKVKEPRAFEALINALKNKDLLVRAKAAEALGEIKNPKAVEPLIAVLTDEEETVREFAAKALANITGEDFGQDRDKWLKWWEKNKENIHKRG
jgi:HEAT repeat protein